MLFLSLRKTYAKLSGATLIPGIRSLHFHPERRQVWSSNERYAPLRTPSWSSQQGWHADATAGAWVASSMSGPILPLIYSMQVLESPIADSIFPRVSLAVVGSLLSG